MFEPRFYRNWSRGSDLISFEAKVRETDLFICASKNLKKEALESISRHRASVESYIEKNPVFLTTLKPVKVKNSAPKIVRKMADASAKVGVGPMASVAGAIAEFVGKDLLKYSLFRNSKNRVFISEFEKFRNKESEIKTCSQEIIVENGGDIFIKTSKKRLIGIYAGRSKFTGKIALEILGAETPLGICTSSGTVGHSLSFGNADAVVVISNCTLLADASATAIGNLIKEEKDIPEGLKFAKSVKEIKGVVIIKNNKIGMWGNVKISSLW